MSDVQLAPDVNDFLHHLPTHQHRRCIEALKRLQDDPFRNRPKCDVKKLSGEEEAYRLRVGDYRFIHVIDDGTIFVEQPFKREKRY